MNTRLLSVLFLSSLLIFTPGNGLLPILPMYAEQLGATPGEVGVYMAVAYLALVVGNVAGGWVAGRFRRLRPLWLIAGMANVPAIWLTGRVSHAWQLAVLLGFTWTLGGLAMGLVTILAGYFARPEERGRIFGILGITSALGMVIGGMLVGPIVDRWGYGALFDLLALMALLTALLGFWLEERPALPQKEAAAAPATAPLGAAAWLVLAATFLSGIAGFTGRLGASLAMPAQGFTPGAITVSAAIGGLVALPLAPLIGRLSDRHSRKLLLGLCYLGAALGLGVLAFSTALWQFWLASVLCGVLSYAGTGPASALIADVTPRESMGRALSFFNASMFLGGIVGFALAGIAMQQAGVSPTVIASSVLMLAGLAVLGLVRAQRQAAEAV